MFILSPMGQKKLTVLTYDRIKEGLFTGKMYGRFARRPIKGAGNNEVTVRRGSTEVATHYLAWDHLKKRLIAGYPLFDPTDQRYGWDPLPPPPPATPLRPVFHYVRCYL